MLDGAKMMNKLARNLIAEFFDPAFYLSNNPDVKAARMDPLEHYLSSGQKEGRAPAPWFDAAAYRALKQLGKEDDAFLHLIGADPNYARHLRSSYAKANPAVSRKVKPPTQPFYALAQQKASDLPVVYTAIAGTRHALPNNTTYWNDMRVFGDTPLVLNGWQFHPSLYWDSRPKLVTLFHKYCITSLFPEGTKLIWIDSRVSVQQSVLEHIAATLDDADLCVFKHYERDCIFDELNAIVIAGRAPYDEVEEYERYLRELKFPEHDGLFETGVLGMKCTARAARDLQKVFGLARRYVARDQVILPLILRGSELKVRVFNQGETNLRNTPGVFVHPW
ncbi:hypothetical protein GU700_07225 [Methylobacterium sp. NI91]|nr:hypothetical protein GU700_07225 [Methylobacterium sp. NI91]